MAIGASKLDDKKAQIIKDLLETGDYTHQQIADMFGVSRGLITNIRMGRRWNDETKSFIMKSNDLRDFGKDDNIVKVTITYGDGREMVLR